MAAYGLFAVSLLRRREEFPSDLTLEQAFEILEGALVESHQHLPEGFTWKEALETLRSRMSSRKNIDWKEIEDALKTYQEFRYGGHKYTSAEIHSVLLLAKNVRRA